MTRSEATIVVYNLKRRVSTRRRLQYVGLHNRLCYGACR